MAKYHLGHGNLFEMRPPLIALFMVPFAIISAKFAFFAFMFFSLVLGFVTIKKFADLINADYIIMLLLIFNIAILNFGFRAGPDLLTIFLLIIAICMLILNKQAGIFIGLTTLLRFNAYAYLLLLLLRPKPKDLLRNILGFFLISLPWFIYNKIKYGNYFASILQNYAENYVFRNKFINFNLSEIIFNFNYVAILFGVLFFSVIIIYIRRKQLQEKIKLTQEQIIALIATVSIFCISFYTYITYSVASYRLLLPTTLFFATTSSILLQNFNKEIKLRLKLLLLILFTLSAFVCVYEIKQYGEQSTFRYLDLYIKDFEEYTECAIISNYWIVPNYYGFHARPLPETEVDFLKKLDENYVAFIFPKIMPPDYIGDLGTEREKQSLFFVLKNENKCNPKIEETDKTCKNECQDYCNYLESKIAQHLCRIIN